MRYLTLEEVQAKLAKAVDEAGSVAAYARQIGSSDNHIRDVLRGYRTPGDAILEPLGLQKAIFYLERNSK